jgi:hypothetical protein
MKNHFTNRILVVLTIFLLTLTTKIKADTSPAPGNRSKAGAQKTISDYFRVPGFINPVHAFKKDTSEKVKVVFTTGSDGRVNFVLANCVDPELKKHVEYRLTGLLLTDLAQNVVHSVTISFVHL